MEQIGVRALRLELSRVLDRVREGETVVVTRDGEPIAKIVPVQPDVPPGLAELIRTGRVSWSGARLTSLPEPVPLIGEGPTVSELLIAQRRGDALPG